MGGFRRGVETQVEVVGAMACGGPPMRRDTIFRIASITKPIVAVAAMGLVEAGRLALDEPVDVWLPELADRRVLRRLSGRLDATVPAPRAVTLRDLLTMRMGLGYLMDGPWDAPILKAANERGLLLGPPHPQGLPAPDEWMRRLGELPLMFAPGERWQYDVAFDVLGVLIARSSGKPLDVFLRERIFAPLEMWDTDFWVPPEKVDRLATQYANGEVYDPATGGEWSRSPAFTLASGGLVSTVDNLLSFGQALLEGGTPILKTETLAMMTTPDPRGGDPIFVQDRGWGLGMAIKANGRYGWDGGFGTSFAVDPLQKGVGVLLTQAAWFSPEPPKILDAFWEAFER